MPSCVHFATPRFNLSAPMRIGSKILGFAQIAFGLTLLYSVGVGFFGGHG